MRDWLTKITAEVGKAFIGSPSLVEELVAAVAVSGHVLLEGPPGTAKTTLANALARALGLSFKRVQFTPDMLPSDLTGTMTLRGGELVFRSGPVFTNVLLADEINRTPPRTQSALLEAMQERHVSVDGTPHGLPDPFLVLATINPIEYEGTYPLPEAQLDRFLLKLEVGYPSESEEAGILRLGHHGVVSDSLERVAPVSSAEELADVRARVDATTVSDEVVGYVASIVRRTRDMPSTSLGASPRAGVHLLAVSKAIACIEGRDFVTPDDVQRMAPATLRHRVLVSPEAELERYTADQAISTAIAAVPVPR